MSSVRWRCTACDLIVPDAHLLREPDPFAAQYTCTGCPQCYALDSFVLVCDEPGCVGTACIGFPTDSGYRQTCSEHAKAVTAVHCITTTGDVHDPLHQARR